MKNLFLILILACPLVCLSQTKKVESDTLKPIDLSEWKVAKFKEYDSRLDELQKLVIMFTNQKNTLLESLADDNKIPFADIANYYIQDNKLFFVKKPKPKK